VLEYENGDGWELYSKINQSAHTGTVVERINLWSPSYSHLFRKYSRTSCLKGYYNIREQRRESVVSNRVKKKKMKIKRYKKLIEEY
jgi:hypothetical protein